MNEHEELVETAAITLCARFRENVKSPGLTFEQMEREWRKWNDDFKRPWLEAARAAIALIAERMETTTQAMADAWEEARPIRKGPYKNEADEQLAYADGNWLAMLRASPLYPPKKEG